MIQETKNLKQIHKNNKINIVLFSIIINKIYEFKKIYQDYLLQQFAS